MQNLIPHLDFIHEQEPQALRLLEEWVNISSGSDNLPGLQRMAEALKRSFSSLGAPIEEFAVNPRVLINSKGERIEKPHGKLLRLTKHPEAPIQVALTGHMDTVFSPSHPFQKAAKLSPTHLQGPGAADMKGGLMIMLLALQVLERSPFAGKLGWRVLLTPDEEVGSVGSEPFLHLAAEDAHLGMIFEPAFADGSLVNQRKGSAKFTVIARGVSAHAGRDFQKGRNAIASLSRFVVAADALTDFSRGITYNVGAIEGGGPINIVPDFAICYLNVRMNESHHLEMVRESLKELVAGMCSPDGITFTLHEIQASPPKIFDEKTQALFASFRQCGEQLGLKLQWQPSGGLCEGNILAAAGLPTIDSLGVIGGNLHTSEEYMIIPSLAERARLSALYLLSLACGDINPVDFNLRGS